MRSRTLPFRKPFRLPLSVELLESRVPFADSLGTLWAVAGLGALGALARSEQAAPPPLFCLSSGGG